MHSLFGGYPSCRGNNSVSPLPPHLPRRRRSSPAAGTTAASWWQWRRPRPSCVYSSRAVSAVFRGKNASIHEKFNSCHWARRGYHCGGDRRRPAGLRGRPARDIRGSRSLFHPGENGPQRRRLVRFHRPTRPLRDVDALVEAATVVQPRPGLDLSRKGGRSFDCTNRDVRHRPPERRLVVPSLDRQGFSGS